MWSAMPSIRSRTLSLVFEIPTSRTLEFWRRIEEGEFHTTRCRGCGALHFPPVADCPECRSSEMEWVELDGRGVVAAFTHVVARPASFQGHAPYTIAIARLEEGVRVLAWLRDADITRVEVGMRVRLQVGRTPEGEASYWFVPA
ncbi:hypothetical protein AC482_02535 [miscellaneous Crenarchaeota group-15 archaeon DG-45]|uniref:Zn-ribbon domain-containing OB-fold protein n=1 Tax=miscellaneous Crenarchaeota group-15 archaeon DG-45 TaxID=1685127 RepID=A0A0M0BQT1_9ARCH|nr:MAG: hypothetical protein AC482_02535 [miscellaneous Crenarchaeota group-15 archaeon DG-45]